MSIFALKIEEIGVFGANKVGKPWQIMSWVRTFSKSSFGEIFCLDRIIFLWMMASLLIKEEISYEEMTCISYIFFCRHSALPPRCADLLQRICLRILQPTYSMMTCWGDL